MTQKDKKAQTQEPSAKPRNKQSDAKKTVSTATAVTIAVATILGGVAAGISIWQFGKQAAQDGSHSPTASPMLAEQGLISRLIPGDDYDYLRQIIGAVPEITLPPISGDTLYQFNRPWEYIDLLVNAGRVLSVGVAAKTGNFRPTLHTSGSFSVIVNGPPIAQQANSESLIGAVGECGGNTFEYFDEGFSLPLSAGAGSFIFGWDSDSVLSKLIPGPACLAVWPINRCTQFDHASTGNLSLRYADCLSTIKFGQEIGGLSPSEAIVVAPGQSIIPEMMDVAIPPQ